MTVSDSMLRLGLGWWLAVPLACTPGPSASTAPTGTDASRTTNDPSSADTPSAVTSATERTSSTDETASVAPSITRIAPFVAAVHGMAVDDDGLLYFSDSFLQHAATPYIYRLAPPYRGKPEATSLTGKTPAGLAVIDGNLHVCDVAANVVTRHDAELVPQQVWSVPAPWNVTARPSGSLMAVTSDGRLFELAPKGAVTELRSGLDAPFDVVATPSGGVWISEQVADSGQPGRVIRWEPGGGEPVPTRYPWANPEGLALDPHGDLWVAETELRELLRVSPDGRVERMAEVDGLPIVITPLPSGDLLVSVTGEDPHLLRIGFHQ